MIDLEPRLPEVKYDKLKESYSWTDYLYFKQRFNELWRTLFQTLLDVVTTDHPSLKIPVTTIDAGSNEVAPGTAALATDSFNDMLLPNTANTTSSSFQIALSYVGKGVLQRVIACSQNSGATSTAAGMSVKITIDSTEVYNAVALSAVSRLRAVVGQLQLQRLSDDATKYVTSSEDAQGLPFRESCVIEYASGTNGQGVQIGWNVSKKE